MKTFHLALPLIFIGILSGCASVLSGSKQNITIVTPEVTGSECSLSDSKGRVWYIENAPGTAVVKKGDGPISVICKKEGYAVGLGQVSESISPTIAWNLLFPVGFFIDGLTGSAEKYDSNITIEMEPLAKEGEKKPWE